MPGDEAPFFEGLKGTDGNLYSLKDLNSELFKVLIEKEDNVNFQVYLAIEDI